MVDGTRAYDRARAGEVVELKGRAVTVFALIILPEEAMDHEVVVGHAQQGATAEGQQNRPVRLHQPAAGPLPRTGEVLDEITLVAHVSKGTYIRSLARDIARALGTVGHVTMLRRLRAGPFSLTQAISLDKLNDVGKGAALENILLPLEAGLDDIPALNLGPEQASAVRQGRVLTGLPHNDGLYWARKGDTPLALVELSGGDARVVRGFNLPDVAE